MQFKMDVQTNTDQLEHATIANIKDYLVGIINLSEYHKRKLRYENDLTVARLRNYLGEEAEMSPASVDSDSAYSSSPPTPLLHYNQDPSYSPCVQDIGYEDRKRVRESGSPGPSSDHQDTPTTSRIGCRKGLREREELVQESSKRQTTNPSAQQRSEWWTGIKRAAADIDEPDPKPPKRKRNRGPKPRILHDGKGPMQLWQLIIQLLVSAPASGPESGLVEWTREQKYGFKILQPEQLAQLWGKLKKKPAMNYDKLARSLRYYYDKSMLKKVPGKENTYEFTWDISEMLGYDPVHGSPVPEPVLGSPISIPAYESPVSSPSHASLSSDQDNGLPVSTEENTLCVSNPLDGLPVSRTFNTLPCSNPLNSLPVYNPMDEFLFPVQELLLPDVDMLNDLSVTKPTMGGPFSSPVKEFPIVLHLEPSLPHPPNPLDFAMLVESDQKCNFYEVS